jgi:hypothetical protein
LGIGGRAVGAGNFDEYGVAAKFDVVGTAIVSLAVNDLAILRTVFLGDGGKGAEELVGDVGEDGGAAGGDFVLGEKE